MPLYHMHNSSVVDSRSYEKASAEIFCKLNLKRKARQQQDTHQLVKSRITSNKIITHHIPT